MKIDQGKINLDLGQTNVIENNDKIDLVDGNKDECEVKNLNPLKDIHKRLLFADNSYFPSHFQKKIAYLRFRKIYLFMVIN